jgi:hypothetical protein
MTGYGAAIMFGLAVSAAACAATPKATSDGAEFALPSGVAAQARVRNMSISTASLYNMPLQGFDTDLRAALSQCATGDRDIDLRAHVEQLDRAHLLVTFEMTDPGENDRVVGRYRILVDESAPLVLNAAAPGQSDTGVRTGQALCARIFG